MKIRTLSIATAIALFVAAPLALVRAQTTSVPCTDGTTSTAVGKGACSGHGGVKKAAKTADATTSKTKPAAKAPTKSAAKTPKAAATKTATKTETPSTKKTASTKPAASAADKDSKDATAECKDGTYSHAATHTGACSGHGGVKKFLK